jgi:hypothetical protein
MLLDKKSFEQALKQDIKEVSAVAPQSKNLFGQQVDIQGIPDQGNTDKNQENKNKSKRDLMWEQRMQAKKNLVNPPLANEGSLLN